MSGHLRVTSQMTDPEKVIVTLECPVEVLDRINNAEPLLGEQRAAKMRDNLLEAIAAMVIASLDEFRMGPIFQSGADDRRLAKERQDRLGREAEDEPRPGDDGQAPLEFGNRVK